MRKGISPLVASVLLIAITIAIAAVLASWVSTYTEEALPPTACVGGDIDFVSSEYPKWTGSDEILSVVEAKHVTLSGFKTVVLMNDGRVYTYDNQVGSGKLGSESIAAGSIGTVITEILSINESEIDKVQVITGCADVKTDLEDLSNV